MFFSKIQKIYSIWWEICYSKRDRIIISNPDIWLILNQCTFSGRIEGGNVSLYPKRDKKEKGVSFIDNQEVEIRFDSQEAILRPCYIFTDVSKVLVSGNANGCIFSNSYSAKENFSHFSFENVIEKKNKLWKR